MEKWDKRFLELAKLVSSWSRDPSTQVGSVIVDKNKRIISTGFNGFPQKINDDPSRYLQRDLKLKTVLHAEENAILFAKQDLKDCTVYIHPFLPCSNCACKIIQTGIKRVVSYTEYPERWKESFEYSLELLKEAEVELTLY